MGDILLSERITLDCCPQEAFDLIADNGMPGWDMPTKQSLRPGVPLLIPVHMPDSLGGQRADILGRVVAVSWPRRFVIRHELPWTGTITVTIRPEPGGGSAVHLVARLDEELLVWARRALVSPAATARQGACWRLGLISSGSGPASVFSMATRNMATLAVEQVNADGGVLGRSVELVVGDDGTHPGMGAAELVRLIHAGCRVVLANVTSAVFRALRPVARRYGALVIHTPLNEGGPGGEETFRLGERPLGQSAAAIPAVMRASGGSRFYLAGNDYSWPRGAHRCVRRVVERAGGSIAAEAYVALGSNDFTSVIGSIARSGADLVVSTFVGADEVAFERQMHALGVRSKVQTLALVLDESTHEYIGSAAGDGLWTAFSYFESLNTTENHTFKQQYRARFGGSAPPPSSLSEAVFDGVHLVCRAIVACRDFDPMMISRQLRDGVTFCGPRGEVSVSWRGLRQPLYLAQSRGGALQPIERVRPAAR